MREGERREEREREGKEAGERRKKRRENGKKEGKREGVLLAGREEIRSSQDIERCFQKARILAAKKIYQSLCFSWGNTKVR